MVGGYYDVPIRFVHNHDIGWAAAFVDDFGFEFTVHILNIEQVAVFATDAASFSCHYLHQVNDAFICSRTCSLTKLETIGRS